MAGIIVYIQLAMRNLSGQPNGVERNASAPALDAMIFTWSDRCGCPLMVLGLRHQVVLSPSI